MQPDFMRRKRERRHTPAPDDQREDMEEDAMDEPEHKKRMLEMMRGKRGCD